MYIDEPAVLYIQVFGHCCVGVLMYVCTYTHPRSTYMCVHVCMSTLVCVRVHVCVYMYWATFIEVAGSLTRCFIVCLLSDTVCPHPSPPDTPDTPGPGGQNTVVIIGVVAAVVVAILLIIITVLATVLVCVKHKSASE